MVFLSALKACFNILRVNGYKILYRASGGQYQNLNFAHILSIDRFGENRQNQFSWSVTLKQPKFEAK